MSWALAVVDDGITNALQRRVGKPTAVEFDYCYGSVDTDDGVAATHGNLVFQSALAVSRAYDVIGLKIAAADAGSYFSDVIEAALQGALRRRRRWRQSCPMDVRHRIPMPVWWELRYNARLRDKGSTPHLYAVQLIEPRSE